MSVKKNADSPVEECLGVQKQELILGTIENRQKINEDIRNTNENENRNSDSLGILSA